MSPRGDARCFALKVSVPGRDDYFVEHTEPVPEGKTPRLGRSIPVTVSSRGKISIIWSQV